MERFRREARAAAKLSHPNIVQVYGVGKDQDHHYIAQELIDGGNLKDEVEKSGPLGRMRRSKSCGLSRWRYKPPSSGHHPSRHQARKHLEVPRGEIKVADFGLARVGQSNDLTRVGLTMGTPRYMSPEQVQGKLRTRAAISIRSVLDVFFANRTTTVRRRGCAGDRFPAHARYAYAAGQSARQE